MKKLIAKALILSGVCLALNSCSAIRSFTTNADGTPKAYQDDNLGEEVLEVGAKVITGQDVDITPSSPESGFSPKTIRPFDSAKPAEQASGN
jgi:hypothetical protein